MLRVVRERVVGEITMPVSVRVVAAYNDADDCGGYELELPMRSRLIHLNVRPDIDVFTAGITSGWNIDPTPVTMPDPASTAMHRQHWSNLVAAFLRSRPSLLECPPQKGSWGGYPTPRTWEMVIAAAAACDASGESEEVRELLIIGCIGAAASTEFVTFAENLDMPAVAEVLAAPEVSKPCFDRGKPDRAMVLLLEVAQAVARSGSASDWENAWVIGSFAVTAGFGDLVAWAFRGLPSVRPEGAVVPEEFSTVVKFLEAV
jgi:hypothetical protein